MIKNINIRKRIVCLCSVLILLIAASGCIKVKVKADVSDKGEVGGSMRFVAMPELFGGELKKIRRGVEKTAPDVQIIEVEEDDMSGYDFVFGNRSLEEVGERLSLEKEGSFQKKAGLFKDTYTFNIPFDKDKELEDKTQEELDQMEAVLGLMPMTFTVDLPEPAISSNATTVENDGKTLTWKAKSLFVQPEPKIFLTFAVLRPRRAAGVIAVFVLLGGSVCCFSAALFLMARRRSLPAEGAEE